MIFSLIIRNIFYAFFPALSALIEVTTVKHKISIKPYQQIFIADRNSTEVFRGLHHYSPERDLSSVIELVQQIQRYSVTARV